jgi:hypothetical protein
MSAKDEAVLQETYKEKPSSFTHDDHLEEARAESKGDPGVGDKNDIGDLDVTNQKAFKSDQSDGKVTWTPRTVFAFLSLSGLNVGKYLSTLLVALHVVLKKLIAFHRLSNHSLLCRRLSVLYRRGSENWTGGQLASGCEHPQCGGSGSFHWLYGRPPGPSKYCHRRCRSSLRRLPRSGDCSPFRTGACWSVVSRRGCCSG